MSVLFWTTIEYRERPRTIREFGRHESHRRSVCSGWRKNKDVGGERSSVGPRRISMAVRKTTKENRGLVDAPGKRHRKPPPQERIDKRMGESRGKQMGQKSVKTGSRSGRG